MMSEQLKQDVERSAAEQEAAAAPRVVLLADAEALRCYGPVLRRLAVGLLDEVADLTLVCFGGSAFLNYIPSPPVRLVTETKRYGQGPMRTAEGDRRISLRASLPAFVDDLWPGRRARRLGEALAAFAPTLLHALSERQARLAQLLSRRFQIPYVVSLLSGDMHAVDATDERCRRILPYDSTVAREMRGQSPGRAEKVHLLPIGTHVTKQAACFDDADRIANIFCPGPWQYGHGLVDLINAVKQLTIKGHRFNLTLCGAGSAEHDLRRQVEQLELGSTVHFVPPVDVMISTNDAYKAVLRDVDIVVQPWPVRAWRPELLESMSVGNAVVVANGHNSDLIVNNKTALTIPFGDTEALVGALDRLLKDRQCAISLAQGAQGYLRKHFLASRMIMRLGRVYRRAVQTKTD